MTTTRLPKAVAAEVRFVEEGHHVFLLAEGTYHVISDSLPNTTYTVEIVKFMDLLRGLCDCKAGRHARHGTDVPCKHVAGMFRRLEREGVAVFDGTSWRDPSYTPPPPLTEAELDQLFDDLGKCR
jgi:hypothetical protein